MGWGWVRAGGWGGQNCFLNVTLVCHTGGKASFARGGGGTRSPPTVKISRKASSSNFPMRSCPNVFWAPRSRRNRGQQSGAVCGAPWNINDVALLQFTREHLFSNYTLALSTAVGSPLNQEPNVSRKLLLFMLNIYVQALFFFFFFHFSSHFLSLKTTFSQGAG